MNKDLVSSLWLKNHINDANLIILDATQNNKREKIPQEIKNLQIKGSRYFDIKEAFSNTDNQFPNAFPSLQKFKNSCQNLGICATSILVVYDALGIFSSARVWWMFKTFGHQKVFVLNGGLPDWIENGFETEKIHQKVFLKGNFTPKINKDTVWFFNDISKNISSKKALVIDARSSDRFNGLAIETRKGLRSGNITNSINIPYTDLLENGKFKSKAAIKEVFLKVNTNKPLVFTCGSGITACIVLLASRFVLQNQTIIYDGSWTEYGTLTAK